MLVLRTFLFFAVLMLCQTVFAQKNTYDTLSVIIIKRDSSKILKSNTLISKPQSTLDSSRFVKRKATFNTIQKPPTISGINVNRSIYGAYSDFIIDYVKNYHINHGNRLTRIKSTNRGYFSFIDNVMKRYGMPKELKALAIIESAMNPNAVSPVGAVGPWQFMAPTAKLLGLRVDEQIDERRDFYKSTNAAAKYLRQLFNMFHDWLLVIAAYNSGPSPVIRAINRGEGRSFWDIKKQLPKETQNHVMAFIATATFVERVNNILAMGNIPKEAKAPAPNFSTFTGIQSSNFDADIDDPSTVAAKESEPQISAEELQEIIILKVKGTYTIEVISSVLDVDAVKLRRWNPNFNNNIKNSPVALKLRIPSNKLEQFIIDKDKIMAQSAKVMTVAAQVNPNVKAMPVATSVKSTNQLPVTK